MSTSANQTIADQLKSTGRSVYPDFITRAFACDLRQDLGQIQAQGQFKLAGTGHGDGQQVRNNVRRDQIHWWDTETTHPIQQQLLAKLASLRQTLNRTLYLGLNNFECHYASYGKDSFYKRHLDSFHGDERRKVSVILYLNPTWVAADGGQLRLHPKGEAFIDVDPIDCKLVCFLSGELEHEVLLNHASRLSFTGWFKSD